MAARSRRSVEEMTFWYNATRGERPASPFEMVFSASPRMPGVMDQQVEIERNWVEARPVGSNTHSAAENPFTMGDAVFLRRGPVCDQPWTGPHRVTGIPSAVSVTLDRGDVLRHVSHIRRAPIARGQELVQHKEHTAENNSRTADFFLREDDEEAPLQEEGEAEENSRGDRTAIPTSSAGGTATIWIPRSSRAGVHLTLTAKFYKMFF